MPTTVKNLSAVNHYRASNLVGFGDATYDAGGRFGPRSQPDYQLVVVHAGMLQVSIGAETVTAKPGSVVLLHPGQPELWKFSTDRRTHHTWVTYHPLHMPPDLRRRLAQAPRVQAQSRSFDLIMQAAIALRHGLEKDVRTVFQLLGLAAFNEYLRVEHVSGEGGKNESPAERARTYMEANSSHEDCLQSAARAAGVTPFHLIRLFRKHYQTTPGRHLWQIRIERGAGLLATTGLTIAEIAERNGFKNPFHFSRRLKQVYGVSPREMRQGPRKSSAPLLGV